MLRSIAKRRPKKRNHRVASGRGMPDEPRCTSDAMPASRCTVIVFFFCIPLAVPRQHARMLSSVAYGPADPQRSTLRCAEALVSIRTSICAWKSAELLEGRRAL